MNLTALALRFRWLQLPTGLLILLLQRMPALRVVIQFESALSANAPAILRSAFAVVAMGAYNSLAGATVFNVNATPTAATPTSGAANAKFTVPGTTGTALSVGISVSGAPGNPKSYSVSGALPSGLSVTGGNPVNVSAPYKMTIAGTPAATGSFPVTVTAWDGTNGSGGNSAKITVTFSIAGGVTVTAPSITTQPASLTVTAGSPASFTVAASGSPAPTIQWQKGGANIAGATSTTFTIASATAGDAGSYTAVATNSAGSATSAGATLTVGAVATAPAITAQPASLTVVAGNPASFSITASGSPAPTIQWQKGGANIAGATSATYAIASVTAGDAGSYAAVATNSAGSATSAAATLTVTPAVTAPVITAQPTNLSLLTGGTGSFAVVATGNPAPAYQWQKGGTNIAGATNATYAIANATAGDAGNFTVVVSNSAGSVTSVTASLTVTSTATAPAITTQPASLTVTAGGSASFTVAASGTPTPTYQWQKGGANIAGATSATYTIASVASSDAGSYAAVATNSAGSAVSSAATLTVSTAATPPVITTQPTSLVVSAGGSASFSVAANGYPAPTYQWQKNGVNLAGAIGASYALANVQASDAGNYAAVATNSAGSVTSSSATLTVQAVSTASAPTITTQPAGLTVAVGGPASFTVAASGSPAPTFQWYFSGAAVGGATGSTLTLANVQTSNAGDYYVSVANSAGSAVSAVATLTVQSQVTTAASLNQVVTTGHDAALSAAGASGAVQWKISTNNGQTWSSLADGATYSGTGSSVLEILGATMAMNGNLYRCDPAAGSPGLAGSITTLTVVPAYLSFPAGVSADGSGNLYVSDAGTQTVQKISSGGQVSVVAGSAGQSGSADGAGSTARFNQPGGIAAAADGGLVVSDEANDNVRGITPAGAVTTLAGTAGAHGTVDGAGAAARFWSPRGVGRDASGVVYVTDSLNHTIRKITASGTVSTLAGTAGAPGATDGNGAGARFNQPTGLAVDGSGNVYVADAASHTIRRITPAGAVTTLAGLAGSSGTQDGTGANARFNHPGGLTIGGSGDLFLADTGNSTIRRITPAGVVTTIAGMPGIAGLMDGNGSLGWFDQPEGLTWGVDGNLYVADTGNAAIRKVTLAGDVSTLTLSAGSTGGTDSASSGSTGNSGGGTTTSGGSAGSSAASSSSAGAGGGAIDGWLASGLGVAWLVRWRLRKTPTAGPRSRE